MNIPLHRLLTVFYHEHAIRPLQQPVRKGLPGKFPILGMDKIEGTTPQTLGRQQTQVEFCSVVNKGKASIGVYPCDQVLRTIDHMLVLNPTALQARLPLEHGMGHLTHALRQSLYFVGARLRDGRSIIAIGNGLHMATKLGDLINDPTAGYECGEQCQK